MANFNHCKNLTCVIQLQKKEAPLTLPFEQLNALGFYALIVHDKDIKEDGTPKGKHLHLVLQASKGASFNTWLERLRLLFAVEIEAVSIQQMANLTGCLRYLIHKDDANKHQYAIEEIITNSKETLNANFEYEKKLTTKDLLEIYTEEELIERVPNPAQYLRIRDTWNHLHAHKRETIQQEELVKCSLDLSGINKRISQLCEKYKLIPALQEDLTSLMQYVQFGEHIE